MLDISLPVANLINGISNVFVVLGAVLALTGTIGTIWTSGIKERFADERAKATEAETENAKAEAAKANENAEIVRASNLALQADVERERTARLRLEGKVAPRHLTDAQKSALVKSLKPLAGTSVYIVSPMGDGEAKTLAEEFANVFRAAGWNLNNSPAQAAYSGPHPRGIQVQLNQAHQKSGKLPHGAPELMEALASLGLIQREVFMNLQTPIDTIELRIGSKAE